jgi:hypothetical protein
MERSQIVSNVNYSLSLALIKGGESFLGHVVVTFELASVSEKVFIDYKGRAIHSLKVNGAQTLEENTFRE